MPADLLPISFASTVVGFISFAFTFFTFLRVFWETLQTMWFAKKEVRQTLDNLRTELYGERAYFKNAMLEAKSKSKASTRESTELTPLSILNDSISTMMADFRTMESPFLDRDDDEDVDVEKFGKVSLRGDYGHMNLRRRTLWLHTKADFMDIQNQVTRIQARRIAYETSNTLSCVRQVGKHIDDLDSRVYALEKHVLGETHDNENTDVKRRDPSK
ncbi:MAG: hypothetical protein Q9182_001152 [Xanthomendoza sp. 2 TL-2023]